MDLFDVHECVNSPDYDFLRNDNRFGGNIVLLGVGGSYAYGTNVESSDLDIRGIALNSKREILLGKDWRSYEPSGVDAKIYSVRHVLGLLKDCNPSSIEMLGYDKENYLVLSPIGKKLIENKEVFFTQKATNSFGGYANFQASIVEKMIKSGEPKAKIAKAMMHRVRVYYTAFDILERGELIVRRDKEHDLLMNIRNGEYQNADNAPNTDYEALVNDLEARFQYASLNTMLPEEFDETIVEDLLYEINNEIVTKERV